MSFTHLEIVATISFALTVVALFMTLKECLVSYKPPIRELPCGTVSKSTPSNEVSDEQILLSSIFIDCAAGVATAVAKQDGPSPFLLNPNGIVRNHDADSISGSQSNLQHTLQLAKIEQCQTESQAQPLPKSEQCKPLTQNNVLSGDTSDKSVSEYSIKPALFETRVLEEATLEPITNKALAITVTASRQSSTDGRNSQGALAAQVCELEQDNTASSRPLSLSQFAVDVSSSGFKLLPVSDIEWDILGAGSWVQDYVEDTEYSSTCEL